MASPISASEVYAVAKFAFNIFKACKASERKFNQIGKEVFAMRTVIELVHLDCENPRSIINVTDTQAKSNRKALSIHIRNCKQVLQDVEACLKRYGTMTVMDKLTWAWSGHDEVNVLESNLSSFATQLNGFVAGLTLKGIGAIYNDISRIEEALERAGGNDGEAVKEVMQKFDQSIMTPQCTDRYKSIISSYAKEVSQSTSFKTPRAQTSDPKGPKTSKDALSVPAIRRPKAAEGSKGGKRPGFKDPSAFARLTMKGNAKTKLECWLIQIKSGQLTLFTWEFAEKENQSRGQWKLEEMARQFRACKKSKLNNDHEVVNWVLKDRRKKEEDPEYTWYPYAAKKEPKGSLLLNLGIKEQAMVIIRRKLTVKAQRIADKKEKLARPKREAAHKKTETKAVGQKSRDVAAKRAKDGNKEQSRNRDEIAPKKEQIKQLKEENARLKAQQNHLAQAKISTKEKEKH